MAKRIAFGGRRTLGTAVTGVVVVVAGMLAGAGTAAGEQAVAATVTYGCLFPSGTQQVGVQIGATFPVSGTVGQPIAPADVTVNLTVPAAAVGDLTALGAASVVGTVALTTSVTQDAAATPALWSDLAAPSTPVPSTGDLALAASGAVPPVTVGASGDVTFTAADLALVLTPQQSDGTATDPPSLTVSCALAPADQNALLATVPVQPAPGAPAPAPTQGGTRRGTQSTPVLPKAPQLALPHLPLPGRAGTAPHGTITVGQVPGGRDPSGGVHAADGTGSVDCGQKPGALPQPGLVGIFACATVAGFSNVNKLNGAAFIGGTDQTPAVLKAIVGYRFHIAEPDDPVNRIFTAGVFDVNGRAELPPSKATFLAFGFVPATATMHLVQQGLVDIVTEAPGDSTGSTTTARARFVLHVDNLTVNGVPLDVGPHCQTVRPLHSPGDRTLALLGIDRGDGTPYNLVLGGPLTGTAVIPPFTGCGVGENLNPILTASISGPDNFIKLTQGPFCSDGQPQFCPPTQVKPVR